ncbi:MAG: SAF domain-containing protein [Parascardovia denticolens]
MRKTRDDTETTLPRLNETPRGSHLYDPGMDRRGHPGSQSAGDEVGRRKRRSQPQSRRRKRPPLLQILLPTFWARLHGTTVTTPSSQQSLQTSFRLKKIATAFLISLMAFCLIQIGLTVSSNQSAFVAARDISQGQEIHPGDIAQVRMRTNPLATRTVKSASAVLGRRAAIPLRKGDPLVPTAVKAAEDYPADYTTIALTPASQISSLSPGQKVDLVTEKTESCHASPVETGKPGMGTQGVEICYVAKGAIVLGRPGEKRTAFSLTDSDQSRKEIVFALPVESALALTNLGEDAPILITNIRS